MTGLTEGEMGNALKWKASLAERMMRQTVNLEQLVYGKSGTMASTSNEAQASSDDEQSGDDEFFKPKGEGNKVCTRCFNYQGFFFFFFHSLFLSFHFLFIERILFNSLGN